MTAPTGHIVYLDNNATTRMCDEAVKAMLPYLSSDYANPSSVHRFGQSARQAVDDARAQVAGLVGAADSDLIFTSGGTESINTAVRGLLARQRQPVLITTTVEHAATRELAQSLARQHATDPGTGATVIEIGVDSEGRLDLDALQTAVAAHPAAVVSLLWANNETGVLFALQEVVALCRAASAGIRVHVDATQVVGKMPVDFRAIGIDAASFSAHKFHGPKGVGGLYLKRGVRIGPWAVGGPQEQGRRGGTENVPGIVGMGAAAAAALDHLAEMPRVATLRDRLESLILSGVTSTGVDAAVNGDTRRRLPNTTNIGFCRLEAEAILLMLSERDICASAGAACSSGSLEPSHVLRAMAVPEQCAHGSIRFSLSRYTTEPEVDAAAAEVGNVVSRLAKVLPVGDRAT